MFTSGHEIRNRSGAVVYRSTTARTVRQALEEAVENHTDLSGANLASDFSDMGGGRIIVRRRTELSGANLRGAKLAGAILDAATCRQASFYRADLTNARVKYTNFEEASFKDAALPGVNAQSARFVGANLRRADLRGARLCWADFTGADLRGADLRGADLRAANLTDAILDDTKTAQAKIGSLTKSKGVSLERSDLTRGRLAWATVLGWAGTLLALGAIILVASRF